MAKEERPTYEHTGGVTGKPAKESPATEHQPGAADTAAARNELRPPGEGGDGHRGPTTHDDTRFTSEAEA